MIGLDEHLRVLLPHLGRPLLSRESIGPLIAALRPIPAALAEVLCFECRMGGTACPDFAFGASVAGEGGVCLKGRHPQAALPPRLLAQPNWAAIDRFISAWAEPGSILVRGADEVWLEFDLEGALPGGVRPSFFFGVWTGQADPRSGLGTPPMAVLEAGLGALTGQPMRPAHRARIRTLLEALPPGGVLNQVGLMLSRPEGMTRLCLSGLQTRDVVPFLRRVGWDGSWQALDQALGVADGFVDRVWVDLDVGDTLGPRLGVECPVPALPPAPRWGPFLDHLVDRALCLPGERDALLAYEGVSRPGEGPPWPRDLAVAGLLEGRPSDTYRRFLNHVKLVVDPARSLTAKAYLFAQKTRHPRVRPAPPVTAPEGRPGPGTEAGR
jgi:hypothetical protein